MNFAVINCDFFALFLRVGQLRPRNFVSLLGFCSLRATVPMSLCAVNVSACINSDNYWLQAALKWRIRDF